VLYSLLLEALSDTSISCRLEKAAKAARCCRLSFQNSWAARINPSSLFSILHTFWHFWTCLENGKMQTSEPLILHNTFHSGQCKPRFFHREQAHSFFSFTKGSGDPITVTLQVVAQPLRCWIAQQKMYRLVVSVSGRSKISMSQAILKKSVVTVHHAKASIVNQLCNPRVPGLQGTILFLLGRAKNDALLRTSPRHSRVL
jgi:hypothetical protein